MKLNVFNRKKTALEKLTSTYDVKLDASASQLIMDVLVKVYDNPVETAIREYVSNAYDANVEAGSTEPVHLHVPTEDDVQNDSLNDVLIKSHNVFNMNNKFDAVELQDLPDNADTHVINDNSNEYLDKIYDFVLPAHNKKVITCTNANDEIDWILKNKPNVSYFTKADMDSRANTVSTIIEPLLNNDNTMYVVKMLVKNKQLSSNISLLHLDTAQDTETYLKALYRTSRRYEPKSHNLSFDQKLFIDALCAKGIKILGKKDAAKIVKRLKLLFPDELKLIKDTADEIMHKVQM